MTVTATRTIVDVRSVSRVFPMPAGPVTALREVSLRIDAGEDVADHAPVGRLVGLGADLGEDRVALLGGRVVEGPQRQALRADHRGGLAGRRDQHIGARAVEGAGERDQRAEVPGAGFRGEENPHGGSDAGSGVGFL